VNDSGQIVGESDSETQKRAFVYTTGKMFDLTQLAINLRKAGFSALDVADGINSEGWIVGFGTHLRWTDKRIFSHSGGSDRGPSWWTRCPGF
jgi:probable HAF family extracellular repeat protein